MHLLLAQRQSRPTLSAAAKRSSYGSLRCHDGKDLIILGSNLGADIGGRGSGLDAIRRRITPD
jgi:hypothetical protein